MPLKFIAILDHPISVFHTFYMSALPFPPSESYLLQHWSHEDLNALLVEAGRPEK